MERYDFIIIGGGVSGISFARLLQLSGVDKFLVLEQEAVTGGLCRSSIVDGHVVDTGGGHFLCTRFPEVYRFIFSHMPESEFNLFERVSKIDLHGALVDYPRESNIWQLPTEQCAEFLLSIAANGEQRGVPPPRSFEEWIRWKLGDRIADDYMLPYNQKIWGVSPAEMDIDWLQKIPRLELREIVMACLQRKSDRSKMPSHGSFYYPKAGGFQRLFDALEQPVRCHIRCGEPVSQIVRDQDGLVVNGRYRTKVVINTGPWAALANSPIFDPEARALIAHLAASGLTVSLHEEAHPEGVHWCYEPDLGKAHHRSFYLQNYALASRRDGVMRETNLRRWKEDRPRVRHWHNPYAYPIPAIGWAAAIDSLLQRCEALGIYGLGRWGQWRYFNADVCIREAMTLVSRLGGDCLGRL